MYVDKTYENPTACRRFPCLCCTSLMSLECLWPSLDLFYFSHRTTYSYMNCVMPCVNSFYIKNILKKLKFKSIKFFFVKLYPKILDVDAIPDPRVIFIILIITLNLHDSSLSGSDCNTRPNSLGCGFDCKVVS
jgi:hypothetical protein